MNGKISLRRATEKDVNSVLEIERSLGDIKTYSVFTNEDEIGEEIKNHLFYIIEMKEEIVGHICYEIKGQNQAYIDGIVVMPKFQGQGIARQALKLILDMMGDISEIVVMTHPDNNNKAINLYTSFGFKKDGEQMENYYSDGEPRIKMILEK